METVFKKNISIIMDEKQAYQWYMIMVWLDNHHNIKNQHVSPMESPNMLIISSAETL